MMDCLTKVILEIGIGVTFELQYLKVQVRSANVLFKFLLIEHLGSEDKLSG